MKIRELKENEPLKVTRVTYHFPAWPDPSTGKVDKDAKPIEDERIKTIMFTENRKANWRNFSKYRWILYW